MSKIWTLARRDFRAYFNSPIAYIVIALFLAIMGWMFFANLTYFNLSNMQARQYGGGKGVSITEGIVRPLFGNMNVVLLFIVPFITMRLFAEERKNHTLELLMTSPLTLNQLIVGKFVSALMLLGVMLGMTLVYPIVLVATGNPELGPIFTSLLGTFLLTSALMALGILFSAFTENQIVAAALTFACGLFFWLINWASQWAGSVMGEFFNYLSLINHFNNFSRGLVDTSDVLFYLSFVFVGLFLTNRVLDSTRWR